MCLVAWQFFVTFISSWSFKNLFSRVHVISYPSWLGSKKTRNPNLKFRSIIHGNMLSYWRYRNVYPREYPIVESEN